MASGKDKINIGIIGTGFARTTQIPGFQACENARIVTIASARRERAANIAAEFGIEHATDDWREVVAREDVDLISIVTPPVMHMEMALAALDANKAVLCEKPMAMNAEESDRMRRRAAEQNALALIDHELRFLNGRRKMREMIFNGDIDEVRHATLLFRSDARARSEVEWNWWSDRAQGGGALGAIGSHAVDGFHWLLGAEVSEVFCALTTHVKERTDRTSDTLRAVTTDDEANLLLRFSNSELLKNATANVSLSMVEAGRPEHRIEVFGARGALMIEERGELWHAGVGAGEWQRIEVELGEVAPKMHGDKGWQRGFTNFAPRLIEALQTGARHVDGAATFEDGYRTQLVLDAARRSDENGCWIDLDEAQEGKR